MLTLIHKPCHVDTEINKPCSIDIEIINPVMLIDKLYHVDTEKSETLSG